MITITWVLDYIFVKNEIFPKTLVIMRMKGIGAMVFFKDRKEVTIAELLNRTSFEAYEKMPLFLKLGFAFGIFEKNTVFTVR